MRPVNYARAKQGNDSDSDEAPLVAPVCWGGWTSFIEEPAVLYESEIRLYEAEKEF